MVCIKSTVCRFPNKNFANREREICIQFRSLWSKTDYRFLTYKKCTRGFSELKTNEEKCIQLNQILKYGKKKNLK